MSPSVSLNILLPTEGENEGNFKIIEPHIVFSSHISLHFTIWKRVQSNSQENTHLSPGVV